MTVQRSARVHSWVVLILASLALGPAAAARAQEQAASLEEVRGKTAPGQTLRVVDKDGRVVKGKLGEITPGWLTLQGERDQQRWRFDLSDIRRVERPDSVWSGTLIGLAAGLPAGLALCDCFGGDCCDGGGWAASLTTAALGAGIGALVDAIIGPKVLYRAPEQRREAAPLKNIAVGFTCGVGQEEDRYQLSGASWAATARFGITRHLGVEAEIGHWSGSDLQGYDSEWTGAARGTPVPGASVGAGPGEPTHVVTISDLQETHAAAQAVAIVPIRAVTMLASAGGGIWGQQFYSLYQEYSLADSAHWLEEARHENRTGVGALGSLGLEVPLNRRLALTGTGGVHWVPALDTLLFTFRAGARVAF